VAEFDFIRTLLKRQAAIVIEPGKEYLAETRLQSLAQKEGIASCSELVAQLRENPRHALGQKVVEAMTINETYFFRDTKPFEALREVVLPKLIEARARERRLTVWSAACSTGQEPYSLAMLLREHFGSLPGWQLRIVATDLSSDVIERAMRGRYSQIEVNRGLPAALLVKYFQRHGLEWQLRDDVRAMVEFRTLNLIGPWTGLPTADIVFLRNVLIYFDVETKKQLLARVHQQIRPDGFVFLGGAETTFNIDPRFQRLELDRANCYRL
jgi:chemotaxis protein methyltransferase CheR